MEDNGLTISVSDTGIGMAEADIPRAFSPFTQLDNTLSRRFEGTGLGLPLADSFVRLHDGTLTLRSKPNSGTTAIIHLPSHRLLRTDR
jgi:signal transduction histidine kinase